MQNNKTMINGLLWTFTGTGVQVVLKFLVFIVLSRLLAPEAFGVMSTALALIMVLSVFSKLGIGPSIVQKAEVNIKHIQTGFTLSIIFSVILTSFVWLIAPSVSVFFNMVELSAVLRVLAFVHIIQGFSIVSEGILQRNLDFKKLAVVQIASYVTYGIVGITLSLLDYGVWALVYAYIINVLVGSLILIKLQPHSKRLTIKFNVAKDLLVFGSGYSLSNLYNHFALQGDTFVVGKLLGAAPLGIYSRAYQLFSIPVNLIGTVIEKVLFPSFSKIKSNIKELQKIYINSILLTAIVCLPLSLFLVLIGGELITLLFGTKWVEAIIPFKVLIIALLPRTSYKISDSLIKARGKVFKSANRQFLYGILIVTGVIIGQFYGLVGASVGVLIAIIINYIYMAKIALSLSGLDWITFYKTHLPAIKITILSIVPTLVTYVLINKITHNDFIIIIATTSVFLSVIIIIVYNATSFVFGKHNSLILSILQKYNLR